MFNSNSFDKTLQKIGWGKYQIRNALSSLVSATILCAHILSPIFISYPLKFQCDYNESSYQVRTFSNTKTQKLRILCIKANLDRSCKLCDDLVFELNHRLQTECFHFFFTAPLHSLFTAFNSISLHVSVICDGKLRF